MKSAIIDRLWRVGVLLAALPIATFAVHSDPVAFLKEAVAAETGAARIEIVGDTLVIEGTPGNDLILITSDAAARHCPGHLQGRRIRGLRADRPDRGPRWRRRRHGPGEQCGRAAGAVARRPRQRPPPRRRRPGPRLRRGRATTCWSRVPAATRSTADRAATGLIVQRSMGDASRRRRRRRATRCGSSPRPTTSGRSPPIRRRREPGPVVVGPAELLDDDIVELLRTSYQAGHAIALTGAEAADAELLRGLLGHASGGGWSADIPQADLVAFRRALPAGRPDRTRARASCCPARRSRDRRRATQRRPRR